MLPIVMNNKMLELENMATPEEHAAFEKPITLLMINIPSLGIQVKMSQVSFTRKH